MMLKFEMIHLQFCRLNGGYLAEIQSKQEEDDVYNLLLLDVRYWIGLNDLILEGFFYSFESMIFRKISLSNVGASKHCFV